MSFDPAAAKARLRAIVHEVAFRTGDFTLTSGKKSDFYLDGRMATLHPEGLYLLARLIVADLAASGIDAVGGLTMGADPIAAGVALVSHLEGRPVKAFLVRKEVKAHGTQKRVEGHLSKGMQVAVVEDTLTTGGSVRQAIEEVQRQGATVARVYVLVDREEGGAEELRKAGFDVRPIFKVGEIRDHKDQAHKDHK